MSRIGDEFGGPAKKRSGWLIPIAVFVFTAGMSAVMLAYYLAPSPPQFLSEQPAPTDSGDLVALYVAEIGFHIPANYILFADARRGGKLDQLSMVALLPNLEGYSLAVAEEFASNEADSRAVTMVIREQQVPLSNNERLTRVYLPFVEDSNGAEGPAGSRVYTFRTESGYHGEELYVDDNGTMMILLRCTIPSENVPSPNCLGDVALGETLTLTYRFKRAHLEQWQEIEAGIHALSGAFMDKL